MSPSPKHVRPNDNAASNGVAFRERGQRRLRKVTTMTIAGAIAVTAVTTALASQVPTHHKAATVASGGVASSPAAIAAAQQAANTVSASNSTSSNYNSGSYAPSTSQSAPVASSGGS
jgi:hypothetical protein